MGRSNDVISNRRQTKNVLSKDKGKKIKLNTDLEARPQTTTLVIKIRSLGWRWWRNCLGAEPLVPLLSLPLFDFSFGSLNQLNTSWLSTNQIRSYLLIWFPWSASLRARIFLLLPETRHWITPTTHRTCCRWSYCCWLPLLLQVKFSRLAVLTAAQRQTCSIRKHVSRNCRTWARATLDLEIFCLCLVFSHITLP